MISARSEVHVDPHFVDMIEEHEMNDIFVVGSSFSSLLWRNENHHLLSVNKIPKVELTFRTRIT